MKFLAVILILILNANNTFQILYTKRGIIIHAFIAFFFWISIIDSNLSINDGTFKIKKITQFSINLLINLDFWHIFGKYYYKI
jgi:hypothetical protein